MKFIFGCNPNPNPQASSQRVLQFLVILTLTIGLLFRFTNLEQKIYWVDEVSTATRLAGFTHQELIQSFARQPFVTPNQLLDYQRVSAETSLRNTLDALQQSPEQAPLYYLFARGWVQIWGSSKTAIRSLSAIISLGVFPGLYWLAIELFQSRRAGWIALTLVSLSPFYVAYAQEARPYSLWMTLILVSSAAFLQALRLNTLKSWLIYAITLCLSFYTSLFSAFLVMGQLIYLAIYKRFRVTATLKNYLLAVSGAIIAFMPWLWVMIHHTANFHDNTSWMRVPLDLITKIAIWMTPILLTFGDLPLPNGVNLISGLSLTIAVLILAFALYSAWFLQAHAPWPTVLFIGTLTLTTPLSLMFFDGLFGGQVSANPRYMIPVQVGLLLTATYLLAQQFGTTTHQHQRRGWVVLLLLLGLGLVSCGRNLHQSPYYQKSRNLHNLPISQQINASHRAVLIAEPAVILDLLSLSHDLDPSIQIYPLTPELDLHSLACQFPNLFLFQPSPFQQQQVQAKPHLNLRQIYQPQLRTPGELALSLWRVVTPQTTCRTTDPTQSKG